MNRLEFLTQNDWVLIAAKARRQTFTTAQEIITQGLPGDMIYILRSGSASVELSAGDSKVKLATLNPGDICGEMSFLEKGNSTAAVVANSDDVQVDAVQGSDLRQLFEAFPGLGVRFYRSLAVVLARRLRDTSKDLSSHVNTTRVRRSGN